MNIQAASVLCFGFGVLLIAFLVIIKRRDAVALKFFFFSLVTFGWASTASFWLDEQYNVELTYKLIIVGHLFVVFVPILWLDFLFTFMQRPEPFKGFYFLSYLLASFLAFAAINGNLMYLPESFGPYRYVITPKPLYAAFAGFYLLYVPYSLYFLVQEYLKSTGEVRAQLRYFLWATAICFGCGGHTFFLIYRMTTTLLLFLMPIYPLLMGIALLRYGLFDERKLADAIRRERLTSLGLLTASINHEIKNPLYIIQGESDSFLMLSKENPTDFKTQLNCAKSLAAKSKTQSTRAIEIMQKFSSFAKKGLTDKVIKQRVQLIEVIQGIKILLKGELERKKVVLTLALEEEFLEVDRHDIEEILFNLIENAVQAMNSDEGNISISSRSGAEGKLTVTVSDNGQGLTKVERKNIFQPFYTSKASGSGLGLYIVKQLVERNGGKIKVESIPGKGTRFELEFLV